MECLFFNILYYLLKTWPNIVIGDKHSTQNFPEFGRIP